MNDPDNIKENNNLQKEYFTLNLIPKFKKDTKTLVKERGKTIVINNIERYNIMFASSKNKGQNGSNSSKLNILNESEYPKRIFKEGE